MSEQTLKAEYIVIEEAARLLGKIKRILSESRRRALHNLCNTVNEDMPKKELIKEARSAIMRELLEYFETELNYKSLNLTLQTVISGQHLSDTAKSYFAFKAL